jgi:hypothetical protein
MLENNRANKYKQPYNGPYYHITQVNPATGWFQIKEFNDKKSITVTNIVEQQWLTHYL